MICVPGLPSPITGVQGTLAWPTKLHRKLAAILSPDAVGYSRLRFRSKTGIAIPANDSRPKKLRTGGFAVSDDEPLSDRTVQGARVARPPSPATGCRGAIPIASRDSGSGYPISSKWADYGPRRRVGKAGNGRATRACRRDRRRGYSIFGRAFKYADRLFVALVEDTRSSETGLDAGSLELEITEGTMMEDTDRRATRCRGSKNSASTAIDDSAWPAILRARIAKRPVFSSVATTNRSCADSPTDKDDVAMSRQ